MQIKTIHSLQHKKFRQKLGLFIAEGNKIISELLAQKRIPIEAIYALPSWIETHQNLETTSSVPFIPISEKTLKNLSTLTHPQEVLALCKITEQDPVPILNGKISILLESLRDPGNLGTIIRIADWFGIPQIICSSDCVDVYNPKVVQATMGSITRVEIWYGDLLPLLKVKERAPLYATILDGTPLTEQGAINEGIIAIGNESNGLSSSLLQLAEKTLTIPRKGQAESLNAAIATGIVCSHLCL